MSLHLAVLAALPWADAPVAPPAQVVQVAPPAPGP